MTYVLHGARGSGSCAVECVLAEIGAEHELSELSLRDDDERGGMEEAIVSAPAHRPTGTARDLEELRECPPASTSPADACPSCRHTKPCTPSRR